MFFITHLAQIDVLIKKSHFIGIALPCVSENDVLCALKKAHQTYHDASHIVYAYRLKTDEGILYRFHDAGEPTGTAGKPVFQHLEGKNIVNCLLIIVRYFGGIKLGAGGLTRAYSQVAKQTLDSVQLHTYIERSTLELTLDYRQLQTAEYWLKKLDGTIISQSFEGQVTLIVELPSTQVIHFQQAIN